MVTLAPARVGWCPGALRPMATGDGLLVRLKPQRGVLAPVQAVALAELALRHGNGTLEVTARANLQIRGVSEAGYEPLLVGLHRLGLVDDDPGLEAIRNVVVSPLVGRDGSIPPAAPDRCSGVAYADATSRRGVTRRIAAELEGALRDAELWRLPAKWSFVIDDGGPLSLRDVPADVRIEMLSDDDVALSLADDPRCAVCRPTQVVDRAVALCRLAIAGGGIRAEDLVRSQGASVLLGGSDVRTADRLPPRRSTVPQDVVGPHGRGTDCALGLAPPFGSFKAADLLDLARQAMALQACDLRLTPWRVLLVTGLSEAGRSVLARDLARTVWSTDPDDPRLAVSACSGRPACRRGSTPVPADAADVARALGQRGRRGIAVHVSGCAKGCAHPRPAPVTLVGRDGRYDLVLNGKAGDKPVEQGLPLDVALCRIGADGT